MISAYEESVINELKHVFENKIDNVSFLNHTRGKDLQEQIAKGNVRLPAVQIYINVIYVDDITEKTFAIILPDGTKTDYEYNFYDSIPSKYTFRVSLFSQSMDELIEMETIIEDTFSTNSELFIEPESLSGAKVPFHLVIDATTKPRRENITLFNGVAHQTTISMCTQVLPDFALKIHAAKLELDKDFEQGVFYRGAALESLQTQIQGCEGFDEQYRNIDKALNEIRGALNGYPAFESFPQVCAAIGELRCDAAKAIDYVNFRKKEREKEIRSLWNDDSSVLQFTDAVLRELRSKLSDDISLFGGSEYNDPDAPLPGIALYTFTDFFLSRESSNDYSDFENCKTNFNLTYKTVKKDGTTSKQSYGLNAFPFRYILDLRILAKTKEGVEAVRRQIVDIYGDRPTELLVPAPHEEEAYIVFYFSISPSRPEIEQLETSYRGELLTTPVILPYNIHGYNQCDIDGNKRIQERLLRQARFCSHCLKILDNKNDIKKCYENIMKERTMLGQKMASDLLKKMKDFIQYGIPATREEVMNAFGQITLIYTELYDNLKDKWSLERILANVDGYKAYFKKRTIKLLDLLNLPIQVDVDVRGTPYNNTIRNDFGMDYLISSLFEKDMTLGQALDCFPTYLSNLVAEYREREAERSAARAERREAVGKFARDSAVVATGVAVGNKVTGNTRKNSGAISGKENAICSMSCPNYQTGRKCKVGSHPSRCQNSL